MLLELRKRCVKLFVRLIFFQQQVCGRFVDHVWCDELFFFRVFAIAENEDIALAFAGRERQADVVAADGLPAVRDAVLALAGKHRFRIGKAAIRAAKRIAVGVKPVHWGVDGEDGEMIAPLAVFALMIDATAFHLNFTDGVVALEVAHVVHGVPKAELDRGEEVDLLDGIALVRECHPREFAVVVHGNEGFLRGGKAVFCALQDRITESVAATKSIKFRTNRLPSGGPYRCTVFDIEIVPVDIQRVLVVAIARQTKQFCIFIETISTSGVRNKPKKIPRTKVVDPREWCLWRFNHVFPGGVVKNPVFHSREPPYCIFIRFFIKSAREPTTLSARALWITGFIRALCDN